MPRSDLGFSLLELMIVVAIISILAIAAVPSYQSYTKRARFAEVVNATESFKTAVAIALQQGYLPKELKNGAHGIPENITPTRNLNAIVVKNAVITALGSDSVDKATYILTPDPNSGAWAVSGTCIQAGLCSD